jgi:hypothetical protein
LRSSVQKLFAPFCFDPKNKRTKIVNSRYARCVFFSEQQPLSEERESQHQH